MTRADGPTARPAAPVLVSFGLGIVAALLVGYGAVAIGALPVDALFPTPVAGGVGAWALHKGWYGPPEGAVADGGDGSCR